MKSSSLSVRLKHLAKAAVRLQHSFTGTSPTAIRALTKVPRFLRELRRYRSETNGAFPAQLKDLYPILTDYSEGAGSASGHYFHQDLWVARRIFQCSPRRHVDVGSRIDGFVAHLLTFMPVTVIDVRPLPSTIPGLTFLQADSMESSSLFDTGVDSLSSLHAIEHFGLGRYGDPIDPNGWQKGIANLKRMLAPGGTLYFSVPIGRERVHFNAHRIFDPRTILSEFLPFKLEGFVAVNDSGDLDELAPPEAYVSADYACGIFVFRRPN